MTEMNETAAAAFGSSKELGRRALDVYEQAVDGFVEAEQQVAEAAPLDWLKSAIGAHATLVHEVNAAYLKAAREALA